MITTPNRCHVTQSSPDISYDDDEDQVSNKVIFYVEIYFAKFNASFTCTLASKSNTSRSAITAITSTFSLLLCFQTDDAEVFFKIFCVCFRSQGDRVTTSLISRKVPDQQTRFGVSHVRCHTFLECCSSKNFSI